MKIEKVKETEKLWKDKKQDKKEVKERLLYGNEPTLTDDEKKGNEDKMLTEIIVHQVDVMV